MPIHHRVIHLFMAVCFIVGAACVADVADAMPHGAKALMWLFALPLLMMAGHGLHRALGRAAEM